MGLSEITRKKSPLLDAVMSVGAVVVFYVWAILAFEVTAGERSSQKVVNRVSYGLAALVYRSTKISDIVSFSWLWVCGIGSFLSPLVETFWARLGNPELPIRPDRILWYAIFFFVFTMVFTLLTRCFLVLILKIFSRSQPTV
jgi:hypothetical protein